MSASAGEGLRQVGVGAVVARQGRLLLVRMAYGWARGRRVIPNGGLEAGESLADGAVRELREEAGLQGTAGRLVAVRSLTAASGSDTFVALAVNAAGPPAPDGHEVDAAEFLDLPHIKEMAAQGSVVRLHGMIAEHVLGDRPRPRMQSLPALDRQGRPGVATVYLV